MKLVSIFFTASESIFEVYLKYWNKRARNKKLVSIFFTASESIFEVFFKYTVKKQEGTGIGHSIFFIRKTVLKKKSRPR